MTETEKELLLVLLAQAVQNTEACSPDLFKRQKELLNLLTPEYKRMINSFYKHGYFVPRGRAWEKFTIMCFRYLNHDVDDDGSEIFHESGSLRKMIMQLEPADLIAEAYVYIDAFEG